MNENNLRSLSPSEAREIGRKGGIASGESRRKKKSLRNELLALLEDDATRGSVCNGLIEKASKGDARAFQVLRDSIGEIPESRTTIRTERFTVSDLAEEPELKTVLIDNLDNREIADCFSMDAIKEVLEELREEIEPCEIRGTYTG